MKSISAPYRVHPRVGGGAGGGGEDMEVTGGPSPRGRGSRGGADAVGPGVGSIPRVGGGAKLDISAKQTAMGPSPRGRGSQRHGDVARGGRGSIPAWAGEPAEWASGPTHSRVHPRVGGGAREGAREPDVSQGPSPRGRGSHFYAVPRGVNRGSIPAWAGEPGRPPPPGAGLGVHPRVGGGAPSWKIRWNTTSGPSPRGRGSRGESGGRLRLCGSIPAWAGEPPPRRRGQRG